MSARRRKVCAKRGHIACGEDMTAADSLADFDTLAAIRDLEAAGIERRHAEAVIGVVCASRAGLATKADLVALRADMRADLYRALWIQTGAIIGVVVAVVKFL